MTIARVINILIVEDNPGDVFLTRTALKQAKVRNVLHVVSNGEEALDYLRQQGDFVDAPRPDLILLDLNLPRLSGHELLAIIKKDDALGAIPVIVLTTSANQDDIIKSYNLNANAYVTKPVNIEQLFDIIKAFESFWLEIATLPSASEG